VPDQCRTSGEGLPTEDQGSGAADRVCIVAPSNAKAAPRRSDASLERARSSARSVLLLSARERREERDVAWDRDLAEARVTINEAHLNAEPLEEARLIGRLLTRGA
jgi:hypothetical protein